MTRGEYLQAFTGALRVAEPKRSELITEIQDHLADGRSENHPEKLLGEPTTLSIKLNRVHIGLLHTRARLVLIPATLLIFFLTCNALLGQKPETAITVGAGLGYYLAKILSIIGSAGIAIWVGRTVIKTDKASTRFRDFIIAVTVILSGYSIVETIYLKGYAMLTLMQGLFTAILWAGLPIFGLMVIALLAAIAASSKQRTGGKPHTNYAYIDALLIVGLPFLVFWATLIFFDGAPFIPFKMFTDGNIPPQTSLIRVVNDFLGDHTGYITIGLTSLTFVLALLRMKTYFRQRLQEAVEYTVIVFVSLLVSAVSLVTDSSTFDMVALLAISIFLAYRKPMQTIRYYTLMLIGFLAFQTVSQFTTPGHNLAFFETFGGTGVLGITAIGAILGKYAGMYVPKMLKRNAG